MKYFKLGGIIFAVFMSMMLSSCGGGGGGGVSSEVGTFSMELTDANNNENKAIYVTIEDVRVHHKDWEEDAWESVSAPNLPKTFNLYELTNGVSEKIGMADIETGTYTQMRLIIGAVEDNGINILGQAHPFANYVIDTGDVVHELKIPSGIQTGIKIIHGFEISDNQTTELLLDFSADKSVVVAGNSGKWMLKPTIKVSDYEELSIVRGRVVEKPDAELEPGAEPEPIKGALVTVQGFDDAAGNEKDEVPIYTTTVTDENGYFAIFIHPPEDGEVYNLVITSEGNVPYYQKIDDMKATDDTGAVIDELALVPGGQLDVGDIQLLNETEPYREVTASVTINGADDTQFVSLSFRQETSGNPVEKIEIFSVSVLNDEESFTVTLPEGTYSVVAWTPGLPPESEFPQEQTIALIISDEPNELNIIFPVEF